MTSAVQFHPVYIVDVNQETFLLFSIGKLYKLKHPLNNFVGFHYQYSCDKKSPQIWCVFNQFFESRYHLSDLKF